MSAEGKGKRPYKVWDSGRQIRKGLVVASFNELIEKGREKLELGEVRIKVVLEADGTQVEDPEYFYTLPENTVFLLLRQGEHWYPAGVEVLRQDSYCAWIGSRRFDKYFSSSPRKPSTATRMIVSGVGESAIQRHEYLVAQQQSVTSTPSPAPTISVVPGTKSPVPPAGGPAPHGTVTTIYRDGKKETLINDIGPVPSSGPPPAPLHAGTVINHDSEHKSSYPGGAVVIGRLSRQGSSVDSSHSATVHVHTPECCMYGHPHTPQPRTRASPTGDQAECDFHCCSLHEEGGRIQVLKAAATSPIQEGERRPGQHAPSTHPAAPTPGPKAGAQFPHPRKGGAQVRFLPDRPSLEKQKDQESSESETENTTNDEEAHTTEKFLLLTDQLSVDTKKHLSIKDIGVILDRLSSKIIDVEKLDREIEEEDCFNWTIKATIRGDTLRELGVIYNGHFYSISEHPGYGQKKEEEEEDVTEEKEAEKEPV